MADQYRRGNEDDRPQSGRGFTERAGDEVRTWFGDDEARVRRHQDERQQYGSERGQYAQGNQGNQYGQGGSYRPQGGAHYGQGPGQGHEQYGQYSGSNYGGASSQGRGYPESDFLPHRVGSSPRESEQRDGVRDEGRTSGSSGEEQRRVGGESSWGSAGSYGRSQGAGSYGGGQSGSYGGGYGGDSSVGSRSSWGGSASGQGTRESYFGRGPKDYKRSDDRIREDVSERLAQDHYVDASEISVQVQSGEVTLTGTVADREQKRRAEYCAEAVSGVRDVTNNLRINRGDTRGQAGSEQQSPASDTSSSILGLGGQKSRESEGSSATQSASSTGANAGRQSDSKSGRSAIGTAGTSGSSGTSA